MAPPPLEAAVTAVQHALDYRPLHTLRSDERPDTGSGCSLTRGAQTKKDKPAPARARLAPRTARYKKASEGAARSTASFSLWQCSPTKEKSGPVGQTRGTSPGTTRGRRLRRRSSLRACPLAADATSADAKRRRLKVCRPRSLSPTTPGGA